MITYFQAIILGAVQGITELFPISSLGHSIIIPPLLGWKIDQGSNFYLIFLVATHLATSIVLFFFFLKDWVLIIKGVLISLRDRGIAPGNVHAKIGWLIVIATIPAGILGLLFQDMIKGLLASPVAASIFIALNGLLLVGSDSLKRRRDRQLHDSKIEDREIIAAHSDLEISKVTWKQSVGIGFAQSLALIPGFSRTGATLGGGLLSGLTYENSARFAFLLATPIIFAAAALKLPDLIVPGNSYPIGAILAGALAAAIGAYLSVRFLSKYFHTKTLRPFGIYCLCVGVISLIVFL